MAFPPCIVDRINPIGFVALCLLVVQTTAAVVVTRYSKTRDIPSTQEPYNNSSLVVSTEVVKFLTSLALVFFVDLASSNPAETAKRSNKSSMTHKAKPMDVEAPDVDFSGGEEERSGGIVVGITDVSVTSFRNRVGQFVAVIREENFSSPMSTLKLAVPAGLYTIQNNVIYTALSNLDATSFQVGYQSKVITTALLSVLLLNRTITLKKWAALFLLALGIVLTQLAPTTAVVPSDVSQRGSPSAVKPTSFTGSKALNIPRELSKTGAHSNFFVGMMAVLVASLCSALAGVYFEKILKGTAPSVWMRNAQLAFFSIIIGIAGFFGTVEVELDGGYSVVSFPFHALRRFFSGYDAVAVLIVLIQAVGGLIIACVVKYADNIMKGFATALSIVACGLLSSAYMGFSPSWMFVSGSAVVILATMIYATK